jgi:hypothetical protein
MRRRFKNARERSVKKPTGENPGLVLCPYCKSDTKVRKDRLEAHVRKQHPDRRRPRSGVTPPRDVAPRPSPRPAPPAPKRNPAASSADLEASERVARLARGDSRPARSEEAAVRARLDYLAKVGKRLLPRAYSLAGRNVLFTGDGPYEAYRLAQLLPDEAAGFVNEWAPDRSSFGVVVVGRMDFYGDLVRRAVYSGSEPPRVIPQEGFLDELLFGRDWWNDEVALLNATLNHHAGLRYTKSLERSMGATGLRKTFRWPSTEAEETKRPVQDGADFRDRTPLFELGYRVTGMNRHQRWEVLTRRALP